MSCTIFPHKLTCGLVIPRSKRINEGILYASALLGSAGLSLVLGDIQVKEMSREIGVSKLIVKCLFSPAFAKQKERFGLYKKDYPLDSDITM